MECLYCGREFTPQSGSGGSSRTMCFHCMPANCPRDLRNEYLRRLNVEKARKQKLELGCSCCHYNKNASALEWHHPTDDKVMHPSTIIKRGWKAYQKEIEGCILLCANCHRELHNPESNNGM